MGPSDPRYCLGKIYVYWTYEGEKEGEQGVSEEDQVARKEGVRDGVNGMGREKGLLCSWKYVEGMKGVGMEWLIKKLIE